MIAVMAMVLFIISAAVTVFFFLLSLRRLESVVKNFASLFTGIDHLLLYIFVADLYVRYVCLVIGVFITAFSLVKIIRKMD